MKKLSIVIVLLVAALTLSACGINIHVGGNKVVSGSGNVVTQNIDVSGFDSIRLSGLGDLTITQGDKESLTIEAEDNILAELESRVSGSWLELGTHEGVNITPTKRIRYTLVVKNLNGLDLAGLGNATVDGLKTERLNLKISGSGDLELADVSAQDVRITISGLGSVQIAGEATSLNVNLAGSGDCNAGDLAVKTADVNISGLGGTTVWASDTVDINISGAGNLNYYGSPNISQNISGLGHVKGLGSK